MATPCVNQQKIDRLEADVKEITEILSGVGSDPGLKGEVRNLSMSNNALTKAIDKLSFIVDGAVIDKEKNNAVKNYKRYFIATAFAFIGAIGVLVGIIFKIIAS